ncbi:hypothetical protein QYE76_008317 [Lolium multiflorum]|uniref:Uncharacterized protein n=1 Tax=Lolium multiflorum TaxID=4521 RepID=A0AAD8PMV8_LOLMU|nr:hypothetical protein QYE76_008317 [Lolium multiflorum]
MTTMVALSFFAGAAVVGRSAVRSPVAPRRRALVVRAQAEPDMDPTKETTAETSTPSSTPTPTPIPAAPKPKAKANG